MSNVEGHPEEQFFQDAVRQPATSAGVPDPTLSASAWSADERVAIARRRLAASDWVLLASFLCTVFAAGAITTATRGAHVDPDLERSHVRAVVVADIIERAAPYADPDSAVFCLALFGSIDPTAAFLARFSGGEHLVVPVTRCLRVTPEVQGRDAFLVSVGKMQWLHGGYVQVLVGDEQRDLYTLKRNDEGWRVIRIEPVWR